MIHKRLCFAVLADRFTDYVALTISNCSAMGRTPTKLQKSKCIETWWFRYATLQRSMPPNADGLRPTLLSSGPYRVYFFSHEPNEPPHVHVDRDNRSAKFWLQPVALARNFGFPAHELRRIRILIEEHQTRFLEVWNGHIGTQR
jgi:hypothetical protein